jgi:hypothetical protein
MRSVLTATALTAALIVTGAPLASAHSHGGSGATIRTGSCSGSADWKLKAKHDDGGIQLEWEVDSNHSGQTWRVRVRDNGNRVVATRATTSGASGSFSVERRITNRAGSDSLVARAYNLRSGQTCVGRVTV